MHLCEHGFRVRPQYISTCTDGPYCVCSCIHAISMTGRSKLRKIYRVSMLRRWLGATQVSCFIAILRGCNNGDTSVQRFGGLDSETLAERAASALAISAYISSYMHVPPQSSMYHGPPSYLSPRYTSPPSRCGSVHLLYTLAYSTSPASVALYRWH